MTSALSVGDKLYKYVLEQKVGEGQFGEVWVARDTTVGRSVAIKVLNESMAAVSERLKEAKFGNKLSHPNVVRIEYADVVQHNGEKLVLIAMDHLSRGSIKSQLNMQGFIAAPRAVDIAMDVLRGLEYLHEQRLLHNDIKPSNILIGRDGRAVLTDYGISCASVAGGKVIAPSSYILHRAPETAISGEISVQTDIYQLGQTLFRLTSGDPLLRLQRSRVGSAEFESAKSANGIPATKDFADHVDTRLRKIIRKATHPNPSKRFQSALEMRRALEKLKLNGYWDVDSGGEYIGVSGTNSFTFEVESLSSGYKLTAWRHNIKSKRRTRVSAFCSDSLSKAQLAKNRSSFIDAVIRGKL
jgi:eukaryotic-like serine/threonine-protein kinase